MATHTVIACRTILGTWGLNYLDVQGTIHHVPQCSFNGCHTAFGPENPSYCNTHIRGASYMYQYTVHQTVLGAMAIVYQGVPRGKHGFILWNLIMRFIAKHALGGVGYSRVSSTFSCV